MKRLGSMLLAIALGIGLSAYTAMAGQDPPRRLVAPVRGVALIEVTPPASKVVAKNVVTTIRIKNIASGPIAGFRVTENWFDRSRNAVPGDTYRHPRPIPPGQVIQITLTTPFRTGMGDNRYDFAHANGEIKATPVKTLELEKPVK